MVQEAGIIYSSGCNHSEIEVCCAKESNTVGIFIDGQEKLLLQSEEAVVLYELLGLIKNSL